MDDARLRGSWCGVVVALALVGCGPQGSPRLLQPLGVGAVAPEITAEGWIDGNAPERQAGQVVVLEAWAHW